MSADVELAALLEDVALLMRPRMHSRQRLNQMGRPDAYYVTHYRLSSREMV